MQLESVATITDAEIDDLVKQAPQEQSKSKTSQADKLVELAASVEVFHKDMDEPYASMTVKDHVETWAIRSKGFRQWLAREYWLAHQKAPGSQATQDALNVIAGRAIHDGEQVPVHTRVAEIHDDILLDLVDDRWRAVKITSTGWNVVTNVPVKFRRTRGALPIPEPIHGGHLDDLRPFINLPDDDEQWALLKAFLISALRPNRPQPILILTGEQGSAKSTASRNAVTLIDPKKAPIRGLPRDPRDLMIAATNGQLLAFDNVSKVPVWLSDTLCSLSTGGGYSARQLFSDDGEMIFDVMRPVILNGITDIATRPDLLDRSIILSLPSIPVTDRMEEEDLCRRFEEARPGILGGLLDAVVVGLQNRNSVEMPFKPRMADFAKWASAAEPAHSQEKIFLKAYTGNRANVNDVAIEASVVGLPILAYMENKDRWDGTVGELLEALGDHVDEATRKMKSWPTSRGFSSELKRLAPNLRQRGINVIDGKKSNKGRQIILERNRKLPSLPSLPSLSSPVNEINRLQSDEGDGNGTATVTNRRRPSPTSADKSLSSNTGDGREGSDDQIQPHSNRSDEESGGGNRAGWVTTV